MNSCISDVGDSGPSKLSFQLQSQKPADLGGSGKITADLGTVLDLTLLAPMDGGNKPLVVTKPFEIRSTRFPAFTFVAKGTNTTPDARTYRVYMLVSQGQAFDSYCYWASIPVQYASPTVDYLVGGGVSPLASIYLTSHPAHLPESYAGTVVQPASNGFSAGVDGAWEGPWNFVKFLLIPSSDETPPDYTGWTLEIISSAKER